MTKAAGLSQGSSDAFLGILQITEGTNEKIGTIRGASLEQVKWVDEVAGAVETVRAASEETIDFMGQASSLISEVDKLTQEIREVTSALLSGVRKA